MNKILMDGDKLYYKGDFENIEVDGYATIYIKDIKNYKLNINILDNSFLEIYVYASSSGCADININQSNNTAVTFVHTFSISGDYSLKYRANIDGNNNKNNVFISGVSKNKVNLDVDGVVKENLKGNELNENIKVLTIGGKCFVAPKLHISTLDVIANHNTAISNIREEVLFYLYSKGISKERAISLIEDSYVYGYLKDASASFLDYIKEKKEV